MNILLTVHQFFPEYRSGTEVLTFGVARELLRRGHQVRVLTGYPAREQMPDGLRFDRYAIEGIEVDRFHHAFVPMGGQDVVTRIEYDNRLAARHFAAMLAETRPDVVHFFHLSRLGAGLIDVALASGVPAYCTPTDFWAICPTSQLSLPDGGVCTGPTASAGNCVKHVAMLTRGTRVSAIVARMPDALVGAAVRMADAGFLPEHSLVREAAAMARRRGFNIARLNALHGIFSPTRLMTGMLERNGVRPGLIAHSPFGIDMAAYANLERPARAGRALTFGFIGTLAPHKGCHVLIEAFRALGPCGARLAIYGDPHDFPDYVATLRARAHGVADIEFRGTFPNDRIGEVLGGIDALVVPSLWYENTPLVIYSALAAKCPLIVSDYAGMSEVVEHNRNGLVFAPGNIKALEAALARIAREEGLLERLGKHCDDPRTIQSYVDELELAYERGLLRPAPYAPSFMLQQIRPFDASAGSYLVGWAVAGFDTPAEVSALQDGVAVASTTRFQPRPDVRDGLRKSGAKVAASAFGFSLAWNSKALRQQVTLRIVGRSGTTVLLPLGQLACGTSVGVGDSDFVGLDSEHFGGDGIALRAGPASMAPGGGTAVRQPPS